MPIHRIYSDISELFDGAETLILDSDAATATSAITVKSIIGVAVNNILFFREPGSESAEIIATHASNSPSGNTITLASALVESHPAGTKIYIIRADTVQFYNSATEDDANSDASGLTALAAAQNIDPTLVRNFYDDEVKTSGYYYYRFSDSINSVDLLYSDPIPWGQFRVQFASNEVGYVIEKIRNKLGHEWDEQFSKQDAIDEVGACLRYVQGKMKRWPRYFVPDYVLGQTTRGVFDYALPSNIYDNETNKSIVQVRIGTATNPLIPLDEKEFDQMLQDVAYTQVRIQSSIGATSLNIDNSYDFTATGTVNVFTANTLNAITYAGITRSATAGILSTIAASGDGSITAAHAVDTNVWQNEEEGEPEYFNVRDGRIRIWPMADSTWINKNVFLDYNEQATEVDSESDTIDAPRYDMVKHWLLWQGKAYWRNNGEISRKDDDFIMFSDILGSAIRTAISSQKHKMTPKINTIDYRARSVGDFDST